MNQFVTYVMSLVMLPAAAQRLLWLRRYRAGRSVTSPVASVANQGTSAATAWLPSSVTHVVVEGTCRMSALRPGYLVLDSAGSESKYPGCVWVPLVLMV
jgi:hypothetical protein